MKPGIFGRLAALYQRMDGAFRECAALSGLNCAGCADNCCTSFFQHHTHVEWIYLWKGLNTLPEARRAHFLEQASRYVEAANASLAAGSIPKIMCPLNENGLCALYGHRLMICRLHGTRNAAQSPDGRRRVFPGCSRFQDLPVAAQDDEAFTLDRTPYYQELATLELDLFRRAGSRPRKVNLTLAEMLVLGPPELR